MFTLERRKEIQKIIEKEGRITVDALSETLGVSQVTIRRDLVYLEKQGYIDRTFGGALKKERLTPEISYELKSRSMKDEKVRIGKAAARNIEEGMAILLDAGTTTYEICRSITPIKKISVITYDLQIALFLSDYPQIRVIFVGGEISHNSKSCVGVETYNRLGRYRADIAFIGCDSFSLDQGVFTTSESKSYIKQQAMAVSDTNVLVTTSDKYRKKSLIRYAQLDQFDLCISDKKNTILEKDLKQSDFKYELV